MPTVGYASTTLKGRERADGASRLFWCGTLLTPELSSDWSPVALMKNSDDVARCYGTERQAVRARCELGGFHVEIFQAGWDIPLQKKKDKFLQGKITAPLQGQVDEIIMVTVNVNI